MSRDKKITKALQEVQVDKEEPHVWCVVESEWVRLWHKSKPEVASRVFVVSDFNELPKTFMDWYRITYTAPFYYEFDGKKWNKVNTFEPKGKTKVNVKWKGEDNGK